MKKFLKWLKSPASDFALFILLLILANLAAHNAFLRFDLTAPKSYSLSKASRSIVKNIEEPLNVRVFFADNLPAPYNGVAQYVKDILVEYKGAANSKFSVNYMDMSKPENEKIAREYGLHQIQIQEVKNNEVGFKQAYMGIVVSYGDSIELMDGITSVDGFEYSLTTKISKMISLSDTLAGLAGGEKITLTLYTSDALSSFRGQAEDALREGVTAANKKNLDRLAFRVVSPAAGEVDGLCEKYGLPRLNVQGKTGAVETAVFGAVLEYGDKFALLPVQIRRSLFGYGVGGLDDVEGTVSSALESLLSKTTKIGYITGHGEVSREAQANPYGQQDMNNAANFEAILSDMYELSDIDLSKDEIPVDMGLVIVNGPKADFSETELYKLDQFIMKGGNVLFFVDGVVPGQQDYYGNVSFTPNEINIDRLLEKYGVSRGKNLVLDKNCYTQSDRQTGKMNLYWVPVLQKNSLAKKNVITKNLGYVIMLMNSSLDVTGAEANKNLRTTVLAKSSENSWTMDKNIMLNPNLMMPPAEKDKIKAQNLAVLLEGKFDSAFESAPELPESEEGEVAGASDVNGAASADFSKIESNAHLKAGVQSGKIIVFSSSNITTAQVMDGNASGNPIAMFLLNAVDYLNGNDDFCTMRTKGLSINTLTVKSAAFAKIMQYFNQFGLVALVAVCGLVILKKRSARRKQIDEKYNPDDERRIK